MPRVRQILPVALAVAFLCAGLGAEPVREAGPETVVFETPLGPVTFTHSLHTGSLGIDCLKCHHGPDETRRRACRSCHKKKAETGEEDPPSFYQVKMELCRGCHSEKKENDRLTRAPVSCEQCHDMKKIVK